MKSPLQISRLYEFCKQPADKFHVVYDMSGLTSTGRGISPCKLGLGMRDHVNQIYTEIESKHTTVATRQGVLRKTGGRDSNHVNTGT